MLFNVVTPGYFEHHINCITLYTVLAKAYYVTNLVK